jgi:hypothetical protein
MTHISTFVERIEAWGPDATGSTRAAALMRIGLGCIALIRFGDELGPYLSGSFAELMLSAAFFIFAASTVLGLRSRVASAGLGSVILALYFLARLELGAPGWGHHHVYLLGAGLILLSLTDCGKSLSLDRARALASSPIPPREEGVLLGQRLITLQLAALYFWTAVDKTDWAFISGQRLEQTFTWVYSGRALEVLLYAPWLLATASVVVVVVEYWLAVAILIRKWRRLAIFTGLALHCSFYLMLPVDTYSVTVMVLYLALIDPATVHRFIDRMLSQPEPAR